MLGLAAVAAVAAMAFIGTAAASADHEYIGLCKLEELVLCMSQNLIAEELTGQLLATQIGTGEFKGGLITEKCAGGMAKAKLTSMAMEKVNELTAQITTFTFTECKPCTTVKVTTPVNVKLTMGTSLGSDWKVESTENGKAEFSGCALGATCIFGGKNITALVEMSAGQSILNTNGTSLEFQGGTGGKGFCGENGNWFAKFGFKYTLSSGQEHSAFPTLLNLT